MWRCLTQPYATRNLGLGQVWYHKAVVKISHHPPSTCFSLTSVVGCSFSACGASHSLLLSCPPLLVTLAPVPTPVVPEEVAGGRRLLSPLSMGGGYGLIFTTMAATSAVATATFG